MGVVQAPAGCGESCGLPAPEYRICANCECYAELSSPKILVNVVSASKTMVGWRLAQSGAWQARSQGIRFGGEWAVEFLIRHDLSAVGMRFDIGSRRS